MECPNGYEVANWPDKRFTYKAVQLVVGGHAHLRMADVKRLHSSVLEDALGEHRLFYGAESVGGTRMPFIRGEGYEAVGMGLADVNPPAKTAVFRGRSDGYDIGIDAAHIAAIAQAYPDWTLEVR